MESLNPSIHFAFHLLFSLNAAVFHTYFDYGPMSSFLEVKCWIGCSRGLTVELDTVDQANHDVDLGISHF